MDPTDYQSYFEYLTQQHSALEQQKQYLNSMLMAAPMNSPQRAMYQQQLSYVDTQLGQIPGQLTAIQPYLSSGTDANAGATVDNNAGAGTDANMGNGGAATGGGALSGGGESTGTVQAGNATQPFQNSPQDFSKTSGAMTAPGGALPTVANSAARSVQYNALTPLQQKMGYTASGGKLGGRGMFSV